MNNIIKTYILSIGLGCIVLQAHGIKITNLTKENLLYRCGTSVKTRLSPINVNQTVEIDTINGDLHIFTIIPQMAKGRILLRNQTKDLAIIPHPNPAFGYTGRPIEEIDSSAPKATAAKPSEIASSLADIKPKQEVVAQQQLDTPNLKVTQRSTLPKNTRLVHQTAERPIDTRRKWPTRLSERKKPKKESSMFELNQSDIPLEEFHYIAPSKDTCLNNNSIPSATRASSSSIEDNKQPNAHTVNPTLKPSQQVSRLKCRQHLTKKNLALGTGLGVTVATVCWLVWMYKHSGFVMGL